MTKYLFKVLTTKRQIICTLFFTYIYDLVRDGFIESRRRQLEILRVLASRNQIGGVRCGSAIGDESRKSPYDLHLASPSRQHVVNRRPISQQQSLEEDTFGNQPPPVDKSGGSECFAYPLATPKPVCGDDDSEPHNGVGADDCPLDEMPKFMRAYQYLSHSLIIISFTKYAFLVIVENELFGTRQSFSCYIPGRTAILPELSPYFAFIVLSYHIIYRYYLCFVRKSFQIDCFIFLMYDKQAITEIQTKLYEKLQRDGSSLEAYNICALYRMFFIKVNLRSEHGAIHRLKTNRSLEHWLKLKRFFNYFILTGVSSIAIWSIPLGATIVFTILSSKKSNIIYGGCEAIIIANCNSWSLFNTRQLVWFLCDLVDSFWLLFDTANALVWPFSSMVFCSQDFIYTIDELIKTLNDITKRLRLALNSAVLHSSKRLREYHNSSSIRGNRSSRAQLMRSIEVEIQVAQGEITEMLQQINHVDAFMSRLSAFCIFCWIVTNLYYHVVSLKKNSLLIPDIVVQFMQVTAFTAITITFAFIAQVNSKTRRLYLKICTLVALDPNYKTTKASWLWVLEYFNKDKPRYSFRLGPFSELSLANYLKTCSWLVTGAFVVINLFK